VLFEAAGETLLHVIHAEYGQGPVDLKLQTAAALDHLAAEAGNLRVRAETARDGLLDRLAAELDDTAPLAGARFFRSDELRQAVRAYVLRLAHSAVGAPAHRTEGIGDGWAEILAPVGRAARKPATAAAPAGFLAACRTFRPRRPGGRCPPPTGARPNRPPQI
jgi:hypothetical protein